MRFITVTPKESEKAKGLVVVIDVLRAFSTCCYLFASGAKEIRTVAKPEEAFALKKRDNDYILVGEKNGIRIQGFDYGNSPYEVKDKKFFKKTIIMKTSLGTSTLYALKNIQNVITGSFVNAGAIVNFIKKTNPDFTTFLCTDDKYLDNEDFLCALYIKDCIEGKKVNFKKINNFLMKHPSGLKYLVEPLAKYAKKDFHLCMDLNRFDFIIKIQKKNNEMILKKFNL